MTPTSRVGALASSPNAANEGHRGALRTRASCRASAALKGDPLTHRAGAPQQTAAELLSAATSTPAVTNPPVPDRPSPLLLGTLDAVAVVHAVCS